MKEVKYKILILSDTHGDLEIIKIIQDIEKPKYTIHCGDHGLSENELDTLKMIYVTGNNDWIGEVEQKFSIDNFKFILTHGHIIDCDCNIQDGLYERYKEYKPNFILYGHTHKERIDSKHGIYIINPGSLSMPRNNKKQKTYIILDIYQDDNFDISIKYLD